MNIVITGASRGIGQAEAELLDSDNKLFLIAKSKDSFKQPPDGAVLIGCDLGQADGIEAAVSQITAHTDTIDVLINNVGVMVLKKFEEMTVTEINQLIDVNLRSHMLMTKALWPLLKKSRRSQIVFMSSMAAKSSIVGESVYAATKSGITAFANVLRNELGDAVRVSIVHAWGTDTWGAGPGVKLIQPHDIAETVKFIISRPDTMVVESVELGNPSQWRGGQAPWSPE